MKEVMPPWLASARGSAGAQFKNEALDSVGWRGLRRFCFSLQPASFFDVAQAGFQITILLSCPTECEITNISHHALHFVCMCMHTFVCHTHGG